MPTGIAQFKPGNIKCSPVEVKTDVMLSFKKLKYLKMRSGNNPKSTKHQQTINLLLPISCLFKIMPPPIAY